KRVSPLLLRGARIARIPWLGVIRPCRREEAAAKGAGPVEREVSGVPRRFGILPVNKKRQEHESVRLDDVDTPAGLRRIPPEIRVICRAARSSREGKKRSDDQNGKEAKHVIRA